MKTKSFYARVDFTDDRGTHKAGTVVNLPYENDRHVADALSMVAYGVLSEQGPEQQARPAPAPEQDLPVVSPEGPVVYATEEEQRRRAPHPDLPETPFYDARKADGSFAPKEEKKEVTTHDHSVDSEGDKSKEEAPAPTSAKKAQPKKR